MDRNGHLRVMVNSLGHKFCKYCGQRMLGKLQKLKKHNNRCPDEEPGFLKFGLMPVKCIYSNFEEYVNNPDTEPIFICQDKKPRRGRIQKSSIDDCGWNQSLLEELVN